jgi:hypothetical protein
VSRGTGYGSAADDAAECAPLTSRGHAAAARTVRAIDPGTVRRRLIGARRTNTRAEKRLSRFPQLCRLIPVDCAGPVLYLHAAFGPGRFQRDVAVEHILPNQLGGAFERREEAAAAGQAEDRLLIGPQDVLGLWMGVRAVV